MDITAYVPLSELTNTGISEKWTTYILLILEIFKRGDTDLYPSKRLYPLPEFILRSDYLVYNPLGDDGRPCELDNQSTEQEHLFQLVEVEDLEAILNDTPVT